MNDGISPEMWAALVGQTIVLSVAIIAATIRSERRMTRLETKVEHVEAVQAERQHDAEKLELQVHGISRSLAALEGAHRSCPYWTVSPVQQAPPSQG